MKKIYQKPESKINTIHARGTFMATVSDPNVTINRNASVEAGSVESRRGGYSIWDDEEEN